MNTNDFIDIGSPNLSEKLGKDEQIARQIASLFGILSGILGPDKLVLKAGKLDVLNLMRSSNVFDRVIALQRLVFEDPTIEGPLSEERVFDVIEQIEDEIANIVARRRVEDNIEKKINDKMQQRQEDYVKEIRMQILKEDIGPDTPEMLKKLDNLKKLESVKLAKPAAEAVKPTNMSEIVGQDRALKALLAKVASTYPQHVILYGPPGVGKTTAARLALEEAKKSQFSIFNSDAKFIEVDGTTLRWDPREVTNPLLGSVHDPIYQGAKRDLADGGVPEPKLGLVTEAHGGILFIDEIGELDPVLLNKLLKVIEDKKVMFDSSYFDPDDPNVPTYIRKIFQEGAPADFILIGATTRNPSEINPALRSRTAEVFFEPLTQGDIQRIVENTAKRLNIKLDPMIPKVISDYTIEGRKATNILIDALGMAIQRIENSKNLSFKETQDNEKTVDNLVLELEDLQETIRGGRLSPYVYVKASSKSVSGKIFGLGVCGFIGSVIEIESVCFKAREEGKGQIRFNDTAGSMAKDSVFNAASVFRHMVCEELNNYDIHVNIVGGGDIDGPSAGTAIFLAILSAVRNVAIRQDIAVTGELSIQGKVRAVGGIFEKIYGAKQAGIKKVIIPTENLKDVPSDITGIDVIPVSSIEELIPHIFENVIDFKSK